MSGAEFVAVLSIGASVIAVVDACNKLQNRIKEFEDDKTLRELAAQLRLFSNGIEILRQQHTDDDLDLLTQDALMEILDCCEKRITELDALIASALPAQKNNGIKRVTAAIRNLRDNKRVRDILNSLQRCQQLLVFHMASVSRRRQVDGAQGRQGASGIVSAHRPSPSACLDDDKKTRPRRWPLPIPAQSCVRVAWMDGMSIGASLKFVNTVPYSSPGLTVLARFSAGALGSTETIKALSTLRRNNLLDFNEATVNNEGYLERVLPVSPSHPERVEPTMDVIQYLTEQGVQWRSSSPIAICLKNMAAIHKDNTSGTYFWDSLPEFELSSGHLTDFLFMTYLSNLFTRTPLCLQVAFEISKCDNIYGGTPDLHVTIMTGSLDEVMALVEEKLALHYGTTNVLGHGALHFAIQKPRILAYLLRNGFAAEIEAGDCLGMTPLMYAAASKQLESAKLLLDHGADPWNTNEIHGRHRDSLFWAELYARNYRDSPAFMELLDHYLASVSPRQAQKTVDHCIERLISTSDYNSSEEEDRVDTEILMYLIHLGADLNQVQPNGNTLLHSVKDEERARFLLSLSTNVVNHQNVYGWTPLMVWLRFDNAKLTRALLHAGADARAKDKRKRSALNHSMEELMRISYWTSHRYQYYLSGRTDFPRSDITWESYGIYCVNTIGSSVLLIRAGANLLEGDCCTCYCSTGGCTPLHKLFRTMEVGGSTRDILLFQLPWVLELSLAMEACGVTGVLDDAARILIRQRLFEELKMTHTCCNEKICSCSCSCDHEFYYQHGFCGGEELPIGHEKVTETQRREAELNKKLQANIEDSEILNGHSNESQLISQLANWAVELEDRPIAYMDMPEWSYYREDKEKVESCKRQMTQISHDPVVFIDNSSGKIISFQEPAPLKTWTASNFVNIYLSIMKENADYLNVFTDIGVDSNALALRREALASQLMGEIDHLRSR